MEFRHFTAGNDDNDRRLDKIVRRFLSEESLSALYKSLRKGLIKVNGKKAEGSLRIFSGDDIQIAEFLLAEKKSSSGSNETLSAPLPQKLVLFKNSELLILNKPYDMPVQPGNGELSLSELVSADYEFHHPEKDSLSFKCGPLHRLDKKTTGIIVFSQSLAGARWFSESIKSHESKKIYLGLCQGHLKGIQHWVDSINKNQEEKGFQTVSVNSSEQNGKEAVTNAIPLGEGKFNGKEVTLVQYQIETGRTHQIRSQTAFHGYPLLGDTAYGGTKIDSKKYGREFFLHAYELIFPSDRILELPEKIHCEISDDFKKILKDSLINANLRVKIE